MEYYLKQKIKDYEYMYRQTDSCKYIRGKIDAYKEISEQFFIFRVVLLKGTLCDKNENKLGMCNCCGDNNCHDDFCRG